MVASIHTAREASPQASTGLSETFLLHILFATHTYLLAAKILYRFHCLSWQRSAPSPRLWCVSAIALVCHASSVTAPAQSRGCGPYWFSWRSGARSPTGMLGTSSSACAASAPSWHALHLVACGVSRHAVIHQRRLSGRAASSHLFVRRPVTTC
jgi:hypothetical protein